MNNADKSKLRDTKKLTKKMHKEAKSSLCIFYDSLFIQYLHRIFTQNLYSNTVAQDQLIGLNFRVF